MAGIEPAAVAGYCLPLALPLSYICRLPVFPGCQDYSYVKQNAPVTLRSWRSVRVSIPLGLSTGLCLANRPLTFRATLRLGGLRINRKPHIPPLLACVAALTGRTHWGWRTFALCPRWRQRKDSNPHALSDLGFLDRCSTIERRWHIAVRSWYHRTAAKKGLPRKAAGHGADGWSRTSSAAYTAGEGVGPLRLMRHIGIFFLLSLQKRLLYNNKAPCINTLEESPVPAAQPGRAFFL